MRNAGRLSLVSPGLVIGHALTRIAAHEAWSCIDDDRLRLEGLDLNRGAKIPLRQRKQTIVRRTAEEHRRAPLQFVARSLDRLARLAHRRIHRLAIGQGLVKGAGERCGRRVAHGELHGQHGRNAPLHDRLRGAGKEIGDVAARAFARVEEDEAQGIVVVQQIGQVVGKHKVMVALFIFEVEAASVLIGVIGAVADEMQDMDVTACLPQSPLERGEGRRCQPFQPDRLAILQQAQGSGELLPLPLHVQLGHVLRDRPPRRGCPGAAARARCAVLCGSSR